MIHASSDELITKYSFRGSYQQTTAKFLDWWRFRIGPKTILYVQFENPTEMTSASPISIKMCNKLFRTKEKHILKPLVGYIPK